jgi:rhodanese-related sulfurtransferase
MIKPAAELVKEANATIDTLSTDDARQLVGREDVLFVDVREAAEVAKGKIPGAIHAPRSFLEFYADPSSPYHKPELASGKRLVVYCASGGRSALAAKTLKDVGVENAANMLGGFNGWQQTGGPVET